VSFGKDLQQERERREVSLESIAEGTKVSTRYLRALEADDYANMPGGVFNKGMISSYCSYLGLDEEAWLGQWRTTRSESTLEVAELAEFAENVKRNRPSAGPNWRLRWLGVAVMVLALAALGWAAWHYVVKPRMQGPYPSLPASASLSSAPGGPAH
jgi:cytoskeleton protein RodZ